MSINLSYRITIEMLITESEIVPINVGDHSAELVAMPQTLALAEVGAAAWMLPGEQIHTVFGEHRHREVGAVETIHEDDVARAQMGHEGAEQRLLAAAFAAARSACPAQYRPRSIAR